MNQQVLTRFGTWGDVVNAFARPTLLLKRHRICIIRISFETDRKTNNGTCKCSTKSESLNSWKIPKVKNYLKTKLHTHLNSHSLWLVPYDSENGSIDTHLDSFQCQILGNAKACIAACYSPHLRRRLQLCVLEEFTAAKSHNFPFTEQYTCREVHALGNKRPGVN